LGAATALLALAAFLFNSLLDAFQGVQANARQQGWAALGPEMGRYRNLTDGVVVQLWGSLATVLLFVTPLLSMRLFAEERRQRTFELLEAAPVNSAELVLGKFIGGLLLVWLPLLATLLFPGLLSLFGKGESGPALDWVTVLLGHLGLLAWAATAIALGMLWSAVTDSPPLAGLATAAVLFPWMLLGNWTQSPERALRAVARFAVEPHLRPLFSGVLDGQALLFFASFIFLFLFLTYRVLEARRVG
jgi:ABC-2 type transport system permease protein